MPQTRPAATHPAPDEPQAEDAGEHEADEREADGGRGSAVRRSRAHRSSDEPIEPSSDDERRPRCGSPASRWCARSSMPGVLDSHGASRRRTSSEDVESWYGNPSAAPPSSRASRCDLEREPRGDSRSAMSWLRVRLRDLEHVELGVELDRHRAERRDRLVEDDEAGRQPQVHRVDELERLADHLDRVDLGEPRPVVAVVDLVETRREARPRAPSDTGPRGRRAGVAARRRSRSQRRRTAA